jgi:ubiquinol-cytochrome c reductase iron-sulfur subunit
MAPEERGRAPDEKAHERGPDERAPGARPTGEEASPQVRGAERRIAASFIVGTAAALALAGVYMAGGQPQAEGALLFLSLVSVGVGMVIWGRHLVGDHEVVDERRDLEATPEEREAFETALNDDAGLFGRRKFLGRLLGAAVGALGLAALFPVRSLGPSPGDKLSRTAWHPGARLVDEEGRLMRADTVSVGGIRTVFPEGEEEAADSQAVLVRVEPDRIRPRKGRETWSPEGNVAYSKICPHVGCPVGLYVETTHELVCPCHQSTFAVLDGARPLFGPATRSLPQLPLALDQEGFLIAQADFDEPVGPGYWNRA